MLDYLPELGRDPPLRIPKTVGSLNCQAAGVTVRKANDSRFHRAVFGMTVDRTSRACRKQTTHTARTEKVFQQSFFRKLVILCANLILRRSFPEVEIQKLCVFPRTKEIGDRIPNGVFIIPCVSGNHQDIHRCTTTSDNCQFGRMIRCPSNAAWRH